MTAPAAPSHERPTTSARDLGDLRARLQRWLAGRLPDGAGPEVSELRAPATNGMSSETLLFDASWTDEGATRSRALVARVAPEESAVPVFPVYDLDLQFRVMQDVGRRSAVPVPAVLWSEPDPGALGAPFFVMERVEGEVPPDVMPYNFGSWLSEASTEDQARLQDAYVALLAELHGIEGAEQHFAYAAFDRAGDTPLRRHVAEQRDYYAWASHGGPAVPLIERCFAWLDEHWPQDEGPTVLSWGDARIGNVLFRDFAPVAVLDWEMAGLGPREIDVAWGIVIHRFFEDIATGYGLPGMPHFLRRDDVATTYESLTGHTPRDLDFYTMYAALRHGIVMSRIRRRSVHFGEDTMPSDPDDTIMHRAMLESMLDGTYWS